MPLWAWAGFIVLIGGFGFRLWRAWETNSTSYGVVDYDLETSPRLFWALTALDALVLLFLITLLAMVVVHQAS